MTDVKVYSTDMGKGKSKSTVLRRYPGTATKSLQLQDIYS